MNWHSWFAPEALPVWSSYDMCLALMAAELLRLRQRIRAARLDRP